MRDNDSKTQHVSAARTWLEDRRHEVESQRATWVRLESRWSLARLAAFAAGLALCVIFLDTPFLLGAIAVATAVLFIVAVRKHLHAQARRETADCLLLVTDEALQRCGGRVTCIRGWQRPQEAPQPSVALPAPFDDGPVWTLTDQERDDLDLFAPPVGLFGLLNRTSTATGARRLRDMLERPLLSTERILNRQSIVRWLADHGLERLHLMAALAAARREEKRLSKLTHAIDAAPSLKLAIRPWVLRIWALFSGLFVLFVVARVMVGDFAWGWWLLLLLIINGGIVRRVSPPARAYLASWHDTGWAVRAYLIAARQAATDLPQELDLARLRDAFRAVVRPDALPRLYRRVGWAEHGGIMYELLNLILFVDVHAASSLTRCAVPNREALLAGLSALAELDALCSLASFAAEQPTVCYPAPHEHAEVAIVGGCHPLVAPDRTVPNDARLTPTVRMWVITGSNMAGKSTFLRMVGTNVLLAQIGCVATAREMAWSPLRLITDLRVRDNLAEDESYFLAEVRHLRRLVLPPTGDTPILGLIEEPFRGTNARDQSAASVAILSRLLDSPNLFLVATHDQHLTHLADGDVARNYHFQEDLSGDALVFDYRLREGPAQTRNALRILEREGYPPDLVRDAYAWEAQPPTPPEQPQA